jgi:succinate dehydrogenase/fumarate reductase flavoprotein subunit
MRIGENLRFMLGKLKLFQRKLATLTGGGVNVRFLELKNMLTVADLITNSAYIREESRGTHYRKDYPNADDKNWLKHICLEKSGENLKVSFI